MRGAIVNLFITKQKRRIQHINCRTPMAILKSSKHHIFRAIWITITTGVTAYYWLALYSVFMDMGSAGSGLPQSASQDSKPPMNPA